MTTLDNVAKKKQAEQSAEDPGDVYHPGALQRCALSSVFGYGAV